MPAFWGETRGQPELTGPGPLAVGSNQSLGAPSKEQGKAPTQLRHYLEWQPERCSATLPF